MYFVLWDKVLSFCPKKSRVVSSSNNVEPLEEFLRQMTPLNENEVLT